jgi:predicted ATP-dependent serine protease
MNDDEGVVRQVKRDFTRADISKKLKALLVIAGKVQKDGKLVTAEDFNHYVDGLDTWQPKDEELYRERGKKTAREGYVTMSREHLPAD